VDAAGAEVALNGAAAPRDRFSPGTGALLAGRADTEGRG